MRPIQIAYLLLPLSLALLLAPQALGAAGDRGKPFVALEPASPTAQALRHTFETLIDSHREDGGEMSQDQTSSRQQNPNTVRIAIPVTAGTLSSHFGHCEQFAIVDVDRESKEVKGQEFVAPPAHQPGVLPAWLSGLMVNLVIAGGMGQRAQQLFAEKDIEVLCGAPAAEPGVLVREYLDGRLALGQNVCDH